MSEVFICFFNLFINYRVHHNIPYWPDLLLHKFDKAMKTESQICDIFSDVQEKHIHKNPGRLKLWFVILVIHVLTDINCLCVVAHMLLIHQDLLDRL